MPIMPSRGSSGGRNAGGILLFSDALERHPNTDVIVYNRCSSYGQAGKGGLKLEAKTDAIVDEVREMAPSKLRMIVRGVEEGKVSKRRPNLLRAAEGSRGLILVASDLSRFIRSEDYDRQTNREAWPTPEEFAHLHKLTGGVILATLVDPLMTESERHSLATKRTKKCGRPPSMSHKLVMRIFEELGSWGPFSKRWENSIANVARRLRIPKSRVQRVLDSPVPEQICGKVGLKWKDLTNPGHAYHDTWKRQGQPDYLRRDQAGKQLALFDGHEGMDVPK